MNIIKIKLSAGWDSSENLTKRLIAQFKTNEINLDKVTFVHDYSYDIIVFFNYINERIVDGKKAYLFPHEPLWSGSHQKTFNENITVYGFEKELYIGGNIIETLAHTFYGGRGPWVDSLDIWSYDNLINFKEKKNKNISCSITELHERYGEFCLYPERKQIRRLIKELVFIDDYGVNNKSRIESLKNYKFNLAIENEYRKNWITEKFYDSILTNTIPIYFGCKNIKEIYPENGYILIDDINNLEEIKKTLIYINEHSEKIYNERLEGLYKIKTKYFTEYNLLKKIINL